MSLPGRAPMRSLPRQHAVHRRLIANEVVHGHGQQRVWRARRAPRPRRRVGAAVRRGGARASFRDGRTADAVQRQRWPGSGTHPPLPRTIAAGQRLWQVLQPCLQTHCTGLRTRILCLPKMCTRNSSVHMSA